MEKIFNYPFAKDGDRNTEIPEANAQDNSVSMQSGWTLPYELNPANGGKYIERKDMNEILFRAFEGINKVAEAVDKWINLTTENLNDIKQAGRYYQPLTIQATINRNYPVNIAGYLIVLNNSINAYGVTQIYKIWDSDKIFIRRTINSTTWSNWDSLVLASEFNNKITALQNTDINLRNNKEDKTKFTNGIINATINSNLNNLTQNGFYWRKINEGNPLPTTNGGAVIVNTNNNQVIQYFYTDYWSSDNGGVWFRMRNANNIWSEWHHIENSEHAEVTYRKIADSYTKSEVDNFLNQKENKAKISFEAILAEADLNNYTTAGYYYLQLNVEAGNNFPEKTAGYLIVFKRANVNNYYQIYYTYDTKAIYIRNKEGESWSNWKKIALWNDTETTYRKIADSYTKSEVDTKINSTTHRYKALRCNPSANTIQWQTGGMSISKVNNHTFRITHNLNTTNYCVTCTSNKFGSLGAAAANVVNIQPNYCDIASYWGGDNTNGSGLPTMINVAIFY